MTRTSRELVHRALASADIRPNGDRPWDIRISDDRFYDRVLGSGNLGLGESYMDGWWDVADSRSSSADSSGSTPRPLSGGT